MKRLSKLAPGKLAHGQQTYRAGTVGTIAEKTA